MGRMHLNELETIDYGHADGVESTAEAYDMKPNHYCRIALVGAALAGAGGLAFAAIAYADDHGYME